MPSDEARADRKGDGVVAVSGALTFDTVPELFEQSAGWFRQSGRLIAIDLKDAQRADSAGIALLVEWLRSAQAKGMEFRLLNVPEQVRSLIRVSGLSEALGVNNSR